MPRTGDAMPLPAQFQDDGRYQVYWLDAVTVGLAVEGVVIARLELDAYEGAILHMPLARLVGDEGAEMVARLCIALMTTPAEDSVLKVVSSRGDSGVCT